MIAIYLKPENTLLNLSNVDEIKIKHNPSAKAFPYEVRAYWTSGRKSTLIDKFSNEAEATRLLESIRDETRLIVPELTVNRGRVQWNFHK